MRSHLDPLTAAIAQRLQTLKVLSFALIVGVVTFAIIVASINTNAAPMNAAILNMMRLICGAIFVSGLIAGVMVRQISTKKLMTMEPRPDDAIRMNYFFVATLVAMATLEGAALFACVLVLLSGQASELALAAPPLLVMLWNFPTESRWRRFARVQEGQSFDRERI